jgi:hypothetical protein
MLKIIFLKKIFNKFLKKNILKNNFYYFSKHLQYLPYKLSIEDLHV